VAQQRIIDRRVENLSIEVALFAIGKPLVFFFRYSGGDANKRQFSTG
jgi:hypothetical protein